jgi:glycosyltransferase involved in cell wall biosynthesis
VSEISVIVPTYNRAPVLAATLETLGLQDYPGPFEVLACDDGSDDATPEVVARVARRGRCPLRYLRQERDGFRLSAARNMGLRVAEATFLVVFLDDDMLVPPNFLRTHAAYHAEPDVVTLGYRYLLEPGEGLGLGFRIAPDPRERDFAAYTRAGTLLWLLVAGCNFAARRELVDRAGPFDEQFRGWGIEDSEYAYRLQLLGADLRIAREAFGWHQYDPEPRSPYVRLQRRRRPDFSSQLANLRRFREKYADQADLRQVVEQLTSHLELTQAAVETSDLPR